MQETEGGCLCGGVRYRVCGTPRFSTICHCATCRRASGAPSVAWVTFQRDQVEFRAGTARAYVSSPGVVRQFCGNCGSAISFETIRFPDLIDLTTLSLDDPAAFPPTGEVWLEHRVSWEAVNPTLDQHPRGSGDGT
ncbi:MAG: hypothetical protein JWN43_1518 [Gammaproteobacteria bacterium]|nr:hypothetical protein [Gammaproteobacteria bacterium]